MPKRSKRFWVSGLLMGLILAVSGAGVFSLIKTEKEGGAKVQDPPRRVAVEVQALERRPYVRQVEVYGTVSPLRKGTVSAEISGPIAQLSAHAEPGNPVSEGLVLARIEDTRYRIALDKAMASLEKFRALLKIERSENEKREALYKIAKQRLELARAEYERKWTLFKEKLIAQQELELAESRLELLRSEFEQARSELQKRESRIQSVRADMASAEAETRRIREDLADTFIRAPFDGVVGERYVELGDQVRVNQKLFTVLDVSVVKVIARIPSQEISRIRPGVSVQVITRAYPGLEFRGRVAHIYPEADLKNRTFSVEIHVKNREGPMLLPGMFSRIRIPLQTFERALMVPRDALLEDKRGTHVYVADKATQRAQRRAVVIGDTGPETAMILSGLRAGELIVVKGQEFLHDGALIQWKTEGLDPSTGSRSDVAEGARERTKP